MRRNGIACVALVTGLSVLSVAGSRAQGPAADRTPGTCFEIISPQRNTEPASPILFDKCSGRTWLLARDGARRGGYRWVSLALEGASPGPGETANRPAAAPPVAARPDPTGRKCFTFGGRQYCE